MNIKELEKYKNKISPEVEQMFKEAWDKWGKDSQLDMIIEECSELIKEICKMKRQPSDFHEIIEEMADVSIMIAQFLTIYEEFPFFESIKNRKLMRLRKKLDEEN